MMEINYGLVIMEQLQI